MFSEVCISDFPDDSKVKAFLKAKSATIMSPTEVQRYLKSDPGQAWYIKTPVALYGVTIEEPPYHTCAIRRMTPEGAESSGMVAVANATKAYASSIGGSTVMIPANNGRSNPEGPDILSVGIGVVLNGQPSDAFGVFISNYHGRVPEPWIADGTPGVGVEIRFSRRVINR